MKCKEPKKYNDPSANLDEIMREDARLADKAETLAIGAIIISLLSLLLSLLRLLLQIAK